jgi:hypothetical protein
MLLTGGSDELLRSIGQRVVLRHERDDDEFELRLSVVVA